MKLMIQGKPSLIGSVRVPGDKSISHRTLMLGALANGTSNVQGFLPSGDCLATLGCISALGVSVEETAHDSEGRPVSLKVHGRGLHGLLEPDAPLNCVRSGTSMRLLAGILAGQRFESTLTGASQLMTRPMRRITEPLRMLGADIADNDGMAPLRIKPAELRGQRIALKVASAQVKSAILLAGLFAQGTTTVVQPGPARDHTERMLASKIQPHGAHALRVEGNTVTLNANNVEALAPFNMTIPGDISSAAFLLTAALLLPDSEVCVQAVGVNDTRTGSLDVLRAMGADVRVTDVGEQGGEPVASLTAKTSELKGTHIHGDTVVRMIDEFPILAVAATQAYGETLVSDARELRVKETDRIAVMATELGKLGVQVDTLPDGFRIKGPVKLRGGVVNSHHDHRIAMALAVAGLVAKEPVVIENADCIEDSFPGFPELLAQLGASVRVEHQRV